MTPAKTILLTLFIAIVASYATVSLTSKRAVTQGKAGVQADVLDRVMKTKTLRCGYITYPPYVTKDANTGEFSGLMVDIMQRVAAKMDVKLEWTAETTWAAIYQDLNTGRFDAVCSSVWQSVPRAMQGEFSMPIFYNPVQAWTRGDDTRFDGNLLLVNDASITIPTLDGEIVQKIAHEYFPKAKTISLPQNAPYSDVITNIVTKKADIVFLEPQIAKDYLAANPNSIRLVQNVASVSDMPVVISLPVNSRRLKTVIDTAIMELQLTPALAQMIDKYHMQDAVIVK